MNWFKRKQQPQVLSPLEGYNRWAATYSSESNPIKNLSDGMVEKFLPELTGKSFLDFGCGTGKFCQYAEDKNAAEIIGVDLSPAMINEAKSRTKRTKFISGDLSKHLIGENKFDVVLTALVMGHLEDIGPTLDILLQSLKNGGTFIITDFHPFLTLNESRRTFYDSAAGKNFEVRHHLHLFEEYFSIFHRNKLTVEFLEEPKFNNLPVIFGIKGRRN
jgi:malonyl-CoA O-methyltransferase